MASRPGSKSREFFGSRFRESSRVDIESHGVAAAGTDVRASEADEVLHPAEPGRRQDDAAEESPAVVRLASGARRHEVRQMKSVIKRWSGGQNVKAAVASLI